jgi:methionyl-tRNA formyltransferase
MKVVLLGQAAFAAQVLDGLLGRRHEIIAVYCPPDQPGTKPDAVKERAQAVGIAVHQHPSLKAPAVEAEFAGLQADLGVLAYVTQIVPPRVFEKPRFGSICFHPSLLPRYRGGSAINWQIINGERSTGVSVFWVDTGIDTGPVLLQKHAAIGPDDTAGSLYYNTLFPIGVEAVVEAVDLVAAGTAPRRPQDESLASYDPLCRDEHAAIDWASPVDRVYDLIRGCDPQPGAHTSLRGQKLRLYDCRAIHGGATRPGVVEEVLPEGLVIGAAGGTIRAQTVRFGERKMAAAEFAAENRVTVGTQIG